MKTSTPLQLLLGIAWLAISACGGSDSGGPGAANSVYVSNSIGVDSTEFGSSADAPYRTISFALEAAAGFSREIVVADGIYSVGTGERFPMQVNGDIAITAPLGTNVVVEGAGEFFEPDTGLTFSSTIVLSGSGSVENLEMRSTGDFAVIAQNSSGSLIRQIRIEQCTRGLLFLGNSSANVRENTIQGCSGVGVEIRGSSTPTLARNVITGNSVGVLVDDSAVPRLDLENEFSGNQLCDFISRSSENLNLVSNIWDDDVFSFSIETACEAGANLVSQGVGGVQYQFVPEAFVPVFPGSQLLTSLAPASGEFLDTVTPSFAWSETQNDLVAVGVFETPPRVSAEGIVNTDRMAWFWHSGLGSGSIGSVRYEDGGAPVNGDIGELADAPPLSRGRSYYWIVWEWDEKAIEVVRSSQINLFTIRN